VVLRALRVKILKNNQQAQSAPRPYRICAPLSVTAGKAAKKHFNTEDSENHGGTWRGPCPSERLFDPGITVPPDPMLAPVIGAVLRLQADKIFSFKPAPVQTSTLPTQRQPPDCDCFNTHKAFSRPDPRWPMPGRPPAHPMTG
jgi:hypothetical protein